MAGAARPGAAYSPAPAAPSTPGGVVVRGSKSPYSTVIVPRIPKAVCMVWVQRSL